MPASLLFASLAVLAVSLLLGIPLGPGLHFRFYTPLLVLAVFYVPGVLLLSKLLARLGGGFGSVFQRDYSPLLTCSAMAWTAANLPLVPAAWLLPAAVFGFAAGFAYLYFLILMFFAVRTVFGAENRTAAAVVCLSWIPPAAAVFLWGPLRFVLGWLASPFFLFFAYYYLGSEIGSLGAGMRRSQHFRRMLEAAALNPHDGEAQYQLGLIHQQRRQYTEAIRRFQAAVAIDPTETDAHFQLGRIAREQGRMEDALAHFETVLRQNEKHSSSEIHRELGAIYLALGRTAEAERELALYTSRREYDPEGLYYYGESLESNGKPAEARDVYARAVESARTAPRYRRHLVARWSRLAQKAGRKL